MTPVRTFLLGVATGGRSTAGLLAAAWTTPASTPGWAGTVGGPAGRGVSALLAGGELYADKLASTPDRLQAQPLVARVIGAAGGSAVVAKRDGEPVPAAVGLALAGAGMGALLGLRWRRFGADRGWPDVYGALAEDVIAFGLAVWAARSTATPPAAPVSDVPSQQDAPAGPDVLDVGGEDPVDRT